MAHYYDPLPPFDADRAARKIRLEEDARNQCSILVPKPRYAVGAHWRVLTRAWSREREGRWFLAWLGSDGPDIQVRVVHEWRDARGNWFRCAGTERWTFDERGMLTHRRVTMRDTPLDEARRVLRWPRGARPADHSIPNELR